jgi:hypothetical protein
VSAEFVTPRTRLPCFATVLGALKRKRCATTGSLLKLPEQTGTFISVGAKRMIVGSHLCDALLLHLVPNTPTMPLDRIVQAPLPKN